MPLEHATDRRDIYKPIRERTAARDWRRVHIEGDMRAPAGMMPISPEEPGLVARLLAKVTRGRAG